MIMDIDTLQQIRHLIKKEIEKTKEQICYSVDKVDQLHYAKGRLNGLETVLQDLKDLQNREDHFDDTDQT